MTPISRHSKSAKHGVAVVDRPEDLRLQESIRSRADYSLAIIGNAFVRNGSGRFLNIRRASSSENTKETLAHR